MQRVFSILVLSFVAIAASAATVYNTFGPGQTFDSDFRYAVDGDLQYQAFRFIPTATGELDTITVALARDSSTTRETEFDLYDGTSSALGTLLEAFLVANTNDLPGAIASFSSVNNPLLTQGAPYWLAITEPDPANGANSLWLFNNQSIGTIRLTQVSQTPGLAPAFSVTTFAPEPAAWMLIAIALGCSLALKLRRLRKPPLGDLRCSSRSMPRRRIGGSIEGDRS